MIVEAPLQVAPLRLFAPPLIQILLVATSRLISILLRLLVLTPRRLVLFELAVVVEGGQGLLLVGLVHVVTRQGRGALVTVLVSLIFHVWTLHNLDSHFLLPLVHLEGRLILLRVLEVGIVQGLARIAVRRLRVVEVLVGERTLFLAEVRRRSHYAALAVIAD